MRRTFHPVAVLRATARSLAVVLLIAGGALAASVLGLLRRYAPRAHRRWLPAAMRTWCRCALTVLGVELTVCGAPAPGGMLIASNHVSWLDILVLGASCGSGFVAKAEVARWPALGQLARCADTLFVARGEPASAVQVARRIESRLRGGQRVMLFPEGTTSRGDAVGSFRHRLLIPATAAQALAQPAALVYGPAGQRETPYVANDRFLPHLLRLMSLPRVQARLQFGRPRLALTEPRLLAATLESDVRELHLGLQLAPARPLIEAPVTALSHALHRLPG